MGTNAIPILPSPGDPVLAGLKCPLSPLPASCDQYPVDRPAAGARAVWSLAVQTLCVGHIQIQTVSLSIVHWLYEG